MANVSTLSWAWIPLGPIWTVTFSSQTFSKRAWQLTLPVLIQCTEFLKHGALSGPPRPSVYCSVKCFGGQKPGAALKDGASNRLMNIWIERGRAGARAESLWGHLSGEFRPRGHLGAAAPRTDPDRPPPRCQCYDMCTALLFSFTTRPLHLPGWPSLIKKLDLHAGDQTVHLLLFLLHLHFTSCGPGPARQGW